MTELQELKKKIRNEILSIRDNIPKELISSKSDKIYENLLSIEEFQKSERVAFFIGYSKEVQTKTMIERELAGNKIITVPRVDGVDKMSFVRIRSFDKLVAGYKGILEPAREAMVEVREPEIVILPGTVFDRSGGRIGYGRGYYDRYLAGLKGRPLRIALCFSEQIVDRVPRDEFDLLSDIIITDREVIRIKN